MSWWVHDLSPFMIRFSQEGGIRWYGLAYVLGLAIGWWLSVRWARQGLMKLHPLQIADLVTYVGLAMVIGGRLGYCLVYDPNLLGFSSEFPFWNVLAVWKGGMASHGGIIGMVVGCWLFTRKTRTHLLVIGDVVAITAPIGIALGRLANFINGELPGRPTDVPWAVIFPELEYCRPALDEAALEQLRQIQSYEAIMHIDQWPAFLPIFQRHSPEWYQFWATHGTPRHPSQLYALVLEGLLVLAVTMPFFGRHRRPGLSVGMVFCAYAVARFIDEFFRQWDRGHDPWMDLTKGQLLSLPVLVAGLLFLWNAWRRPPQPEWYGVVSEPPA